MQGNIVTTIVGVALGVGGMLSSLLVSVLSVVVLVLAIRALLKYLRSEGDSKKNVEIRKPLGEALKEQRLRCKMTQEFVADTIGVSRQAVSKWENGTSEPSTTNLCALAKLYGVSAEELLRAVKLD